MTPRFIATNEALYYTLSYFKVGRIATQIKKMGGDLNLSYLDSYEEVTMQSHKDMQDEINQNIIGSFGYIKLSMFEYLRDWLNNWQFNSGFEEQIEYLIDKENEAELKKYKIEIEKDEREYKQTIPPGIGEGDEYEVEIKSSFNFFTKQIIPARKEKLINRFVTTKKPDLIDKTYLSEYLSLVSKFTDSFRRHSEKYVANYFAGKYPDPVSFLPHPYVPKELPVIELSPPALSKKLTVDLSVPQLVTLFCMLREMNVINEPINTELARFIKANFSTKGSTDISEKTLVNLLSSLDNVAIDHWLVQLKQMRITLTNLKG